MPGRLTDLWELCSYQTTENQTAWDVFLDAILCYQRASIDVPAYDLLLAFLCALSTQWHYIVGSTAV
ncbi:hypothetical protein Hypma_014330 [Hypsizygus marmoreus]|uniref:Uncharacterized protein n=1 Tax=Hypsizygus marmoreus TaxID=39966 RepID=A0A369JGX9_HYPMA|nr:hypothetical protein Hypma_014330 [Hypsizygus marmoreus]